MNEILEAQTELEKIRDDVELKLNKLKEIDITIKDQENRISYVSDKIDKKLGNIIEQDKFLQFFKKPYVAVSQGKNKTLVVVPKFIKNFQVGWLWKETEEYYIYQLDQYSAWLGDVPAELLEEINFKKEFNGTVTGDTVTFELKDRDAIKKRLGFHLKDIGDTEARIIKGHIFDVIADMIENGCLPFKAKPVNKDDIKDSEATFKLRDYQKEAYKKFLETGATGVFHPTGAGKSFIALYSISSLKGKKIIFVPTRTLLEQWNYYIDTYIPKDKEDIKIVTYQGWRDDGTEYSLAVFDECQRLPANTFSRVAVIPTKYRLGLSASPHREDNRESYIFALTGFPIGLNWKEYMETVGKKYHPIRVHIVYSATGKLSQLRELLDTSKKTFIFCDTIELGKKIAKEFDIPYIYGETNNRLKEVEDNRIVVISRVGDLGLSVKNLQRIIEVDFLYGSRQQELQRTGRLMHSEETNLRHDIIMTEKEFEQYGKRLWALQEKGFQIKIIE